ncbi:hypothetical protein M0812_04164 [Anaeramoeba flamelloides]|uniref:Uncharacterized protein n=1 Tax=Anaeramoeba flamelloides TaxID=1746091 RepID=A0AAV8AE27_9EUKA|nr:hypothetical protein M0812_04164 [Anaeramoeba flamelloides]
MEQNDLENLQKEKLQTVLDTILDYPQTGLYQGETREDFSKFFKYLNGVFERDEGGRGNVKREIAKKMKSVEKDICEALSYCGCTIEDDIDIIYSEFQNFKKGKLYDKYVLLGKAIEKTTDFLNSLEAENSVFRKNMAIGIQNKILKKYKKELKEYEKILLDLSLPKDVSVQKETVKENQIEIGLEKGIEKENNKEKQNENEKEKEKKKGKDKDKEKQKENEENPRIKELKNKIEELENNKEERILKRYEEEVQNKIKEIISIRKKQIVSKTKLFNSLQQKLKTNKRYQQWLQMSTQLQPFFDEWVKVDSGMGKTSVKQGQTFEDMTKDLAIPLITKKLGLKEGEFKIHANIMWEDVAGEIDFVISNNDSTSVYALVESKARLFDIAAAYRQSGPERLLNGKSRIAIDEQLIELPKEIPCFVVTIIQKNRYHLGFESKLKDYISKLIFDIRKNWEEEEMYQNLKEKMKGKMSPLCWFKKYSKEKLIVL